MLSLLVYIAVSLSLICIFQIGTAYVLVVRQGSETAVPSALVKGVAVASSLYFIVVMAMLLVLTCKVLQFIGG